MFYISYISFNGYKIYAKLDTDLSTYFQFRGGVGKEALKPGFNIIQQLL